MKFSGLLKWFKGTQQYTSWQWQPTNSAHDPNPPITLEDAAGGGSTLTLAPTEGSISFAGVAAALVLALSPSTGAIAFAGNVPSITVANVIAPSTGQVVVAGNTPSIQRTFGAAAGAIVFAGNAPSISQALEIAPASGAIVFAGEIPALSFSLLPTSGQIVFAGEVPTILQPVALPDVVLGGLHKQAGQAHGPFALYNYWRSRLGEEEEKEVAKAVLEAAKAEIEVAESFNVDRDISKALETRRRSEEAYLASYRAALLEQYMEEAIIVRFREEVALLRFEIKRRAALLLLLANS